MMMRRPPRLVLLSLVALAATQPPMAQAAALVWQSAAPYPGPGRHHPITFANETHAFVWTGSTAVSAATSDFYVYEEATDSWTDLGTPADDTTRNGARPAARSFGYGVVLNQANHTKAYLGLGVAANGTVLQDWWEFDMATTVWTRLADFAGVGRRHPAMVAVYINDDNNNSQQQWEIHVGLGDDTTQNLDDWWSYSVQDNSWTEQPSFPGSARHHPFFFGIGGTSFAGLGHSNVDPFIERDWYRFHHNQGWQREADFASYEYDVSSPQFSSNNNAEGTPVTTEARVAGTQFAIELPLLQRDDTSGSDTTTTTTSLSGALGFVLSGDGDDHRTMAEGEFHAFDPAGGGEWWRLPPHPGPSRWAPGSWVMRGTARAYFTSGLDRTTGTYHSDVWRIDLSDLFASADDDGSLMTPPTPGDPVAPPSSSSNNDTSIAIAPSSVASVVTLSRIALLVCFAVCCLCLL